MNIDNGLGAAALATRILGLVRRSPYDEAGRAEPTARA
jgi:hypothetical protein